MTKWSMVFNQPVTQQENSLLVIRWWGELFKTTSDFPPNNWRAFRFSLTSPAGLKITNDLRFQSQVNLYCFCGSLIIRFVAIAIGFTKNLGITTQIHKLAALFGCGDDCCGYLDLIPALVGPSFDPRHCIECVRHNRSTMVHKSRWNAAPPKLFHGYVSCRNKEWPYNVVKYSSTYCLWKQVDSTVVRTNWVQLDRGAIKLVWRWIDGWMDCVSALISGGAQ